MESENTGAGLACVSRRSLVTGAALLSAVRPAMSQAPGSYFAYVGAYTDKGRGIHLYRMDAATGRLTQLKTFSGLANPSSIALDPMRRFLYAAHEIGNYKGTTNGAVSAWSIDRSTGDLTALNDVSSGGRGPAHLSVHPAGRHVLVSNYGGGNVAVLPIQSNGSLGEATDVQAHTGPLGPRRAVYAWPGSFADSGHDAPHAHMIEADHAGRYVFSSDLGTDRIFIWKFDAANGRLVANDQPFLQALPGAGPRHFAFHPNGRWFYSINEEDSTLTFSLYDPANGTLQQRQTIGTLPDAFAGTNFTSEIMVSPDGRFVYGANRLYDTIAIFEINQSTGNVNRLAEEWTRGSYPRNFAIDPTGKFMYVLHTRSDNITVFRIEEGGRRLAFTGQFVPNGNPSHMLFLT
jgi:6-phosphogluconolactonase (cycloisomerase 2 family)